MASAAVIRPREPAKAPTSSLVELSDEYVINPDSKKQKTTKGYQYKA